MTEKYYENSKIKIQKEIHLQKNMSPSGRSLDNTNVLSPRMGLKYVTADQEGGDDLLRLSAGRVCCSNPDTVAPLLQYTRGSVIRTDIQLQTHLGVTKVANLQELDAFSFSDETRTSTLLKALPDSSALSSANSIYFQNTLSSPVRSLVGFPLGVN